MAQVHNLGFPRIGAKRELKFAQESYWKGESSRDELKALGAQLRKTNWEHQTDLDFVPVGDFSFYDQVLDTSFTLGNLPQRVQGFHGDVLDNYFRVARGRSAQNEEHAHCCGGVAAGEMTKWFDTNYHYIVPEFTAATQFKLDTSRLLEQLAEAKTQGVKAKPVILGPITYLAIGKAKDDSDKLTLLNGLLPVYVELLNALATQGVEWVQIDEPILVAELDNDWKGAFKSAYATLNTGKVKLLLERLVHSRKPQKFATHVVNLKPVVWMKLATKRRCKVKLLVVLKSKKHWGLMYLYTAKPSVTTWWNTSVNNLMVMRLVNLAGYNLTVHVALNRQFCSVISVVQKR